MSDTTFQVIIAVIGIATTLVLVKLGLWMFRAAVREAIAPTHARVVILEKHERLIWNVAMQRAFEKLHHADQPVFDTLLEAFRSHEMTEQQLVQFIERLSILVKDTSQKERIPSANLLLEAALSEYEARLGFGGEVLRSAKTDKENVAAGQSMAQEAGDKTES